MPFFERPEREVQPQRSSFRRTREDPAFTRPTLVVPRYLASDLILAVGDERAIAMHGIACYPTGFAFQLQAVSRFEYERDGEAVYEDNPLARFHHYGRSSLGEIPDSELRFGIEYSNGERFTTLDLAPARRRESGLASNAPCMQPQGGSGRPGTWTQELWVWPLPPEGPVTFACEWPAYGIPETSRTLEGDRFRAAGEKAKLLFA